MTRQEELATLLRTAWRAGDNSWLDLASIALRFAAASPESRGAALKMPPKPVPILAREGQEGVEKLVEALRPFALAGEIWMTANETDDAPVFCDIWTKDPQGFTSDPEFTVGDFRRAYQALALIIGVGGEGVSRTNSGGSPAQEPAKSDSAEGH